MRKRLSGVWCRVIENSRKFGKQRADLYHLTELTTLYMELCNSKVHIAVNNQTKWNYKISIP